MLFSRGSGERDRVEKNDVNGGFRKAARAPSRSHVVRIGVLDEGRPVMGRGHIGETNSLSSQCVTCQRKSGGGGGGGGVRSIPLPVYHSISVVLSSSGSRGL